VKNQEDDMYFKNQFNKAVDNVMREIEDLPIKREIEIPIVMYYLMVI
jgi:hypothetical protein